MRTAWQKELAGSFCTGRIIQGPVSAAPPGMPLAGDLLHHDHPKPGQRPAAAGLAGPTRCAGSVGPVSKALPGTLLAGDLLHGL